MLQGIWDIASGRSHCHGNRVNRQATFNEQCANRISDE